MVGKALVSVPVAMSPPDEIGKRARRFGRLALYNSVREI